MNLHAFPAGFKYNCQRCNGRGRLPQYNHIQNGICFSCNGHGSYIGKAHMKKFGANSDNWYHFALEGQPIKFEFKAANLLQAKIKMDEIIKRKRDMQQYKRINWNTPYLRLGRKNNNGQSLLQQSR